MKRKRQSKITDLNFDVLKHVMYHVAVSPDGAGNLARTLSVCRLFKELADDSDILKAAAFDQVNLSGIHESFWRPAGMLCRCLPTGNPTAFNTIRKNAEILNVSYEILKRDMFRGKMILLVRSTALEIANTRQGSDPLQDLCVAVQDSNQSAVFVNGRFCKDAKLANADDFYASGFNVSGMPTPTNLGFSVNALNVNRMPGLNTLGISMARADLEPFGLISPHIHPRATELILVLEGTIYVGFVVPDTRNPFKSRLFDKILHPGDAFVIPQSMVHIQYNLGTTNATHLSSFNSQNPGVHMISYQLFGSNPPILDDVLVKGFQLDKKVVDHLRAQFSSKS